MERIRYVISVVVVAATFLLTAPVLAVIQGIDVSHHQGTINWNSVTASGIQFAFCKATEGVDYIDPRFTSNMSGAIAAGMPIGPYHFGRVNSGESIPTDAIDEANDFVDAIQGYYSGPGLVLRPVLDLENLPDSPISTSVKSYTSQWVRDFCNRVQTRLGFAPIIYTSGNIAQNYLESDIANYDLWFAKPIPPTPSVSDPAYQNNINNVSPPTDSQMGIWSEYDFWQWSWEGVIGGISGNVDRNVFNGSLQELAAEFIPGFIPGDYNGDNFVDASDYTRWRDTMGQSVKVGLGADGNLSGVIDSGDYTVWKSAFGTVGTGAGSASTSAIPEPATIILTAVPLVIAGRNCRRLARRRFCRP